MFVRNGSSMFRGQSWPRRIGLGVELDGAGTQKLRLLLRAPAPQPLWHEQGAWMLHRLPQWLTAHSILFYGYEDGEHGIVWDSPGPGAIGIAELARLEGDTRAHFYPHIRQAAPDRVAEFRRHLKQLKMPLPVMVFDVPRDGIYFK